MAEKRTLARPYAQAVFRLAREQGELDRWGEWLRCFAAIAADAQMRLVLDNPRVEDDQLRAIFLDVTQAVTGTAPGERAAAFLETLIENRRLAILPEICALYESYRAEAEKVVQAEVIAARPVSDAQRQAIAEALAARLGCKVELTTRTDPALIGGAVVRAGDLVIDGSAKGHLERLAQALCQ